MPITKDNEFVCVPVNDKILITDGKDCWTISAKMGAKAVPKIARGEDNMLILTMGDFSLDLPPATPDKSFLLTALMSAANEVFSMEGKIQESGKVQAEMKREQLKLRKELTSSIPMEMPSKPTNTLVTSKKGTSLLNPRVKKIKTNRKDASPFGDEEEGANNDAND